MTERAPDFTGFGWAFPMGVTPSGGIAMVSQDADLVRAMRLVLSTYPGERPMRHEFGCHLRDYIFRSVDSQAAAEIAYDVRLSLQRWEPRVVIETVNVHPHPDDPATTYIDITYTIKATNDKRNLVFPFYSIPDEGTDF